MRFVSFCSSLEQALDLNVKQFRRHLRVGILQLVLLPMERCLFLLSEEFIQQCTRSVAGSDEAAPALQCALAGLPYLGCHNNKGKQEPSTFS